MSEAFVKTLKRDYARVQPHPDALTVLQRLPAWIDDYNEVRLHGAIGNKVPISLHNPDGAPSPPS